MNTFLAILSLFACAPDAVLTPPKQVLTFEMGETTIESVSTGAVYSAPATSDCSAGATLALYNTAGAWFPAISFLDLAAEVGSESATEEVIWSSTDPEATNGLEYTHSWSGLVRIDTWSAEGATLTLDGTTCVRDGECAAAVGTVTIEGALDDRGERDPVADGRWSDETSGEPLCGVGSGAP